MAPRPTFDLETLATTVPAIFDQVQSSTATHKKNCVSLHKLQNASSTMVETVDRRKKGNEIKLVGEKAFIDVFLDMMNRVVVIKKGVPTADRIVKFVGSYIQFINEKNSGNVDEADDEDTPFSRFLTRLLRYLLKGFEAKSKIVRYRCVNFVSEIIAHLGELDQELYSELRTSLLERLCDKEPLVRAHAVISLAKLAVSEEPDDLEDGQQPIVTSLLNSLFYDPAAEVRRAALIHLPFTPATLPALLTRSRDVDPVTRKLLYFSVLTRLAHPKQLTISQREQIVRQGLGDREEAVRLAAAKLLGGWVDLCEGKLLQFLQLFDVRAGDICTDALKSIFVTRVEIAQELNFDDGFWSKLSPEGALLARTFVEHCIEMKDDSTLESCLPVVTALAFLLQNHYNAFLDLLQEEEEARMNGEDEDDDEADLREAKLADEEFIMSELSRLALHLDYSDEIGRRKMFSVIRQMLAHPELPESLITPCIGVAGVLSINERDLIRVVVEVINELRDSEPDQGTADEEMTDADMTRTMSQSGSGSFRTRKSMEDMTPEEKTQADMVDLRCLTISIAVLERVNGSFEENSTLEGILADLIIPSVKRKEMLLREKGLISLGLCCLIAKNMAMSSFQLFLSQVKSAPEALRLKVLQVVFDILMTYEKDLLGGAEEIGQRVIAFIMNVLETEESNAVQALICLGLCKLMLFGLVTDEKVLISLVLLYVSPFTAGNQELRQCLAYFLPAYSYSSRIQQDRMRLIFMTAFDLVNKVYEDLEEDQKMITPLQFGQLLVDWTDPTKMIGLPDEDLDAQSTHVRLAIDLAKVLYDSERTPEDKKCLCQILGKLTLPKEIDRAMLYTAYILISNLVEQCPFEEHATERLFLRFRQRFEQHFSLLLDGYDEQQCFHEVPYQEVFEFIGITRPRRRCFKKQLSNDNASASEGESRRDNGRKVHETEINEEVFEANTHDASTEASSDDEADKRLIQRSPSPKQPRSGKGKEKDIQTSSIQPRASKAKPKKVETESETDSEKSHSEDIKENIPQPLPKTPTKKNGKRIHTPTKTPSITSPAPKRQNRTSTRTRQQKARDRKEPLKNATNKRSKTADTSERVTRPPSSDEDIQVSDDEESEATPQSPIQPRMPGLMQEQIGWDDSSDI